jgi:hypothetical protein
VADGADVADAASVGPHSALVTKRNEAPMASFFVFEVAEAVKACVAVIETLDVFRYDS